MILNPFVMTTESLPSKSSRFARVLLTLGVTCEDDALEQLYGAWNLVRCNIIATTACVSPTLQFQNQTHSRHSKVQQVTAKAHDSLRQVHLDWKEKVEWRRCASEHFAPEQEHLPLQVLASNCESREEQKGKRFRQFFGIPRFGSGSPSHYFLLLI